MLDDQLATYDDRDFAVHANVDKEVLAAADAENAQAVATVAAVAVTVKETAKADMLSRIAQELQDPAYAKLSPAEIAEQLNAQQMKSIVYTEQGPSRMDFLKQLVGFNPNEDDGAIVRLSKALADEYANDPVGMGYAALSPKERDALALQKTVVTKTREIHDSSRIAHVLLGVPFAPNAIDETDVAAALAVSVDAVPVDIAPAPIVRG